jgi:5'-nucleotidase / UDP-sugar diphosphatase
MTDYLLDYKETAADSREKSGWLSAETIAEFGSSLTAGVSGAVTVSLLAASRRTALAIPAAMIAGGITKFGVKTGLEHAFVDKQDRTAGVADLAWGAVDGLAGIAASRAELLASRAYLSSIGKAALGPNISSSVAETAGRQLASNNVFTGIKHGLVRGVSGGAAGSFTWSVPHRLYEHGDELANNPVGGALAASKDIVFDTAIGTAFGGALVGGGTALFRSNELVAHARNAVQKPDLLRLRTLHLNDFHSQNDQLAAIKGVSDHLLADAKKKGMAAQFVSAGDLEGVNVQYIDAKSGMPENSALMKMGVRKFIPGNHTYDLGSRFNVPGYARTMSTLMHEYPDASLIATNLDLSAFPQYQQIAKKYTIDTIAGPRGPEKIATIGLVTPDGTALGDVPGIGYIDAQKAAVETMLDLSKNHGVKKFMVMSHLGLAEDQALAQALVRDSSLAAQNLKVAGIIGGHTHDATAAPIWVGKHGVSKGGLSTLRNAGGYEIPVVQAGSHGRWLGQLDLAIRPDGAADKIQTFGRMHAITPDLPRDAALDAYVRSQTGELAALRQTDYNARLFANLPADNLRTGESALGNLVSDAIDRQVNADAVLTHSGWIRRGLDVNVDPVTGKVLKPVTRETVADMFKSGGNPELEKGELFIYKIRGDELRDIAELSVANNPAPQMPTTGHILRNMFSNSPLNREVEGHGYFLQVAGLNYDFDLSKAVGQRIGSISIRNGTSGAYAPLDPTREYSIASRRFIFDKWTQSGIFGDRVVEQTAVGKSPVEMVGEYIRNRTVDASSFAPEGRITNLTPTPFELPLKASPTMSTPAVVERFLAYGKEQK